MKTYELIRTEKGMTPKGPRYLYQVIDNEGNEISRRTSTREYVAATLNGEFYFGRVDLAYKGNHAQALNQAGIESRYTEEDWKKGRADLIKENRMVIALERKLDAMLVADGHKPHDAKWYDEFGKGLREKLERLYNPANMAVTIQALRERGTKRVSDLRVAYMK